LLISDSEFRMTLIHKMALLTLSAAAVCSAHASPAATTKQAKAPPAARHAAPSPVPEPVHYQLMLVGLGLVVLFGRRKAVRSEPWSNH
jgi:hypothetical protein